MLPGRRIPVHSLMYSPWGTEQLNPGVLAVRYVDRAFSVDGDAVRQMKLPGTVARLAPGEQQLPVRGKLVHPGIAIAIGDVYLSIRRQRQIRGLIERRSGTLDVTVVRGGGARVACLAAYAELHQ